LAGDDRSEIIVGAHLFRNHFGYWMERAAGPPLPARSTARHHRYRSGCSARRGPGGSWSRYGRYFPLSAASPAVPSDASRIRTDPSTCTQASSSQSSEYRSTVSAALGSRRRNRSRAGSPLRLGF